MGRDQTERYGGAGAVLAYMKTVVAASKQPEAKLPRKAVDLTRGRALPAEAVGLA